MIYAFLAGGIIVILTCFWILDGMLKNDRKDYAKMFANQNVRINNMEIWIGRQKKTIDHRIERSIRNLRRLKP